MITVPKRKRQALEFDVQRFRQGGRTVYSLIMDLGTLDSNLPSDVNKERVNRANRKFNSAHSDRIASYIEKCPDWVLGTIILGIDPTSVEFTPFEYTDSTPAETLGALRVFLDGGASTMRILDGQHRRMAIRTVRDLLHQQSLSNPGKSNNSGNGVRNRSLDKLQRLDAMAIPVSIYEEADDTNLRRMFSDLAQTRNIDSATKTRFDDRDPFNRAAVEIVELSRSVLFSDRVEMERTTPARGSNDLLAINQLSRCLKVLNFGVGGRASRARILEAQHSYDQLIDLGIEWADEFLPAAREEYEVLCSIEVEDDYVAKNRSKHLAYSVIVLQMLAGCYHRWTKLERPHKELSDWLAEANFDRESEECIFRKTNLLHGGNLIGRTQDVGAAIQYIVKQAQLANS